MLTPFQNKILSKQPIVLVMDMQDKGPLNAQAQIGRASCRERV